LACIPYDVSEVTGYHSTTETYLFERNRLPALETAARSARYSGAMIVLTNGLTTLSIKASSLIG